MAAREGGLLRLCLGRAGGNMLSAETLTGFILTTDADKARAFYERVLGLEFVSLDNFALVMRSGANMIRIGRAQSFTPQNHTVLGWEVSHIESVVSELNEHGVKFEHYPFVEDPSGIWTAPGGDKVAWFKDPDGNVLSVSQHKG
jgi:catechol 2,3-dioxygenase-like lactoylglutathione lyase family enzyme